MEGAPALTGALGMAPGPKDLIRIRNGDRWSEILVSRYPVGTDTPLMMMVRVLNDMVFAPEECIPQQVTQIFGPEAIHRFCGFCVVVGCHYRIHPAELAKAWAEFFLIQLADAVFEVLVSFQLKYDLSSWSFSSPV